jgi:hypothetical protein
VTRVSLNTNLREITVTLGKASSHFAGGKPGARVGSHPPFAKAFLAKNSGFQKIPRIWEEFFLKLEKYAKKF